jgi:hypothetical protein
MSDIRFCFKCNQDHEDTGPIKDRPCKHRDAQTLEERTEVLLRRERHNPDEYTRLHAILCMDSGWDASTCIELRKFVDTQAIASRLDEIDAEVKARYLKGVAT